MEVYRPSTRDSLQTFLPSQPQSGVSHDRRFSQATSAAQSQTTLQYSDEKSVVEPPFPEPRSKVAVAVNSYPLEPVYHHQPYQQAYWCSDGDIDPVPRYPGTPHLPDVSATLAVPPIERADRFEGTICGVKRGLFILLLTIAGIVLMAIAIGVGLGVGLGHQRQTEAQAGSSSSSSSTSSIPNAAITATPTIPTTFESSSFPSSASSSASRTKTLSAAVPVATGSCPSIQNTQYITSNGKRFFQMCGYDYAGKGEANDIGSARTKTFTQCMEICAKKLDCMGAGWGVSDDNPDQHICWMKNNLRKSHQATSTWSFAILIADTVGNEDEV